MEIELEDKLIQEKKLPFDNLYLNAGVVSGFNKAWMYVLTITFALIGYFLYQSVIAFPLMTRLLHNGISEDAIRSNPNILFDSVALRMEPNEILLLELGMFVFAFIGLWLGLRYFHQKSLRTVLTGYENFRFRRFWFAFLIWAALLVVYSVVSYLLYPNDYKFTFDALGWAGSAMIMFLLMPIQTGFEEIFFRGYTVQGLAQVFKNGIVPMIIMSLLFAFAHMSNPEVEKYGIGIMFTYYTLFALFLGFLTLLDEGIELAFGIHFANNIISSLMVTSSDSVLKTNSILETATINPVVELVVWLVMASFTLLVFKMRYKWRNYHLVIK
jgi:hypothetical protein